jgi:hypothetical protein
MPAGETQNLAFQTNNQLQLNLAGNHRLRPTLRWRVLIMPFALVK